MKKLYVFGIMFLSMTKVLAQSSEIRADKGVVVPQFTTAYINGMANQSKGTVLFDKDLNLMKYWNGSAWIPLQNGASGTGWTLSGDNIYNNNNGNVGIGINEPSRKLEINSGVGGESGIRLHQMTNYLNATVLANIPSAVGLAFDYSENLFVSSFSGNKIHKITPGGVITDFITTNLNGPHDIVLGPDGYLYAANFYDNNILKIDPSTGVFFAFAYGLSHPVGLTFDSGGNLYVSNNGDGTITKINSSGTKTNNWATGLNSPYGCVFDPINNQIFIANYGANEVAKVNVSTGGAVTTFKSGVNFCTGITRNTAGDIFVAQATPNKISQITPNGTMTDYASATYPLDILMNANDELYIAQQTLNRVVKYSANDYNSLLTVNPNGDIKKANLSKNGYKLYLDQAISAANGVSALTTNGIGINGVSISNYGVNGQSTSNIGVIGSSNSSQGVFGTSNSGRGVYGYSNSEAGVYGMSGSNIGVYGEAGSIGVKGVCDIAAGIGVSGNSAQGTGIYGHSLSGFGIMGVSDNVGIKGISATYIGVSGNSTSGTGVHGISQSGYGVWGVSNSANGRGVYGVTNGSSAIGVYGHDASNNLGWAGFFEGDVRITNGLTVIGDISNPSDFRLKKDLISLSSSLTKLSNIKGYNYYWKDSTKSKNIQTGIIAQDLQKILPELVNEGKDGFLSVNYIGLIPHLLEAVKEVDDKNAVLQAENKELKKNLSHLLARLEAIELSLKPASGK